MKQTILIVTGGLLQIPAVEIAHELGLHVVVTDRNPTCECAHIADRFVPMDIFDLAGHVQLAIELKRTENLVAVFTEGADVARTVSLAAAAVGLPCVDPRVAYRTNYKPAMRAQLDKHGISPVRWAARTSKAGALVAVNRIGYPLIIKNTDASASRGTRILRRHNTIELVNALTEAVRASRSGVALIEELKTPKYSGLEHTVETLMEEGRQHRCFITDRMFLPNKMWAVEKGIQIPTRLTENEQEAMYALARCAAIAMGIDFGAAKFDMMWTPDGPFIIEMAARLSGGCECQWLDPLASGRQVIKAAMLQAIGGGIDPELLKPRWERTAVAHSLMPPVGKIRDVTGVEEALQMPGIKHVFMRRGPGDAVPPYHDCVSRAGWVIASGETDDAAWENAHRAEDAIKFEMEK